MTPHATIVMNQLQRFVDYVKILSGDEKGEAQVFCDRFFKAFGHEGYKEAGAFLEYRIKKNSNKGTSFADLVWKPILLLEMKKRGEKLYQHYKQAFDYWIHAVPNRPRYVVLCNFDEFWIFDFDKQIDEPVDKVNIKDLPHRYTALNFLFPDNPEPVFGNDREAVSRSAADKIARLFNSFTHRGIIRETAQKFVLQTVVSMFAEDIGLLPSGIIYNIVNDCLHRKQNSYDLFSGLFNQMNNPVPATGGRFNNVPYFNGGLFSKVEPIDLTDEELCFIGEEGGASKEDWSKVNPAIFGTLFQESMDAEIRHAHGAHFTSEADILRIVNPTIVYPWRDKIDSASTMKELLELRNELAELRILDPACGSGNFLYVAYRELARLEIRLLTKLKSDYSISKYVKHLSSITKITPRQFYGIDMDSFAVELAKVTLMLAKKLAIDEAVDALSYKQTELTIADKAIPLDNLDANFICGDALFADWPECHVIIGNPPYQSKNKIQQELGRSYVNRIRDKFPEVDGRADYCVYWFRKAHDHLKPNQRAGLVGTNTIRQNYSRIGGLDYIVGNGGTITDAVSSMNWSGEAAVSVSIVNWIKGDEPGPKRLYIQEDFNNPSKGWRFKDSEKIGPSLSFDLDISSAKPINVNAKKGGCFQGQTHGHEGFLLEIEEALALIAADVKNREVLHPYLIANELLSRQDSLPTRYVIDFCPRTQLETSSYKILFERVKNAVLPDRVSAAKKEAERNREAQESNPNARINLHHERFLDQWWLLSYPRKDMLESISTIPRYIVCGQVTKRPIFEFISSEIRPNAALIVFPFPDDYSFGILQSHFHWLWFINNCSTLEGRPRYTSNTVFDTFPWPQSPSLQSVENVSNASKSLRILRRNLMSEHQLPLRSLYRSMEAPGKHPLKNAHKKLDEAVAAAYGITKTPNPLEFLLELNGKVVNAEAAGRKVEGPGLPDFIKNPDRYLSDDCISIL